MAPSADTNVILITGANSGCGYEAAKLFYEDDKPYHVLLTARTGDKAQSATEQVKFECPNSKNTIEAITMDLTSDESIEKAAQHVEKTVGRLDTLINNAGATFDIAFVNGKVGLRDCFNQAYDVNVAGTNVVAWTFMPLLLKSARPLLMFVSGLSQITNVGKGPYYPTPEQPAGWPKKIDFETIGYRCSKCALNMMILDWNHKLQNDGVKVFGVSPGFTATNLGGMREQIAAIGGQHPREGAQIYKDVVDGKKEEFVGKIISSKGLIDL